MKDQLTSRLQELRAEFERGQTHLQDLEAQANTIRNALLRISGAIQVLEEELSKAVQSEENGEAQSEAATDGKRIDRLQPADKGISEAA